MEAWGKFLAVHIKGERGEPTLVSSATIKTLHQKPAGGTGYNMGTDYYAGGWIVTTRSWAMGTGGTGLVLTHTGSNLLNYAVIWVAPEIGNSFVVTSNAGQPSDTLASITDMPFGPMIQQYAGH